MDVHHFFESINRRILKRKLKAVIRDKRFYRLLCILIEHDKIALVAKILTDAGVEIDAEQTKTLVGCIAFDDISGALEILQEIGIAGAMFDELKEIIEEMRKGVPLGYFTSQWFGNFYLKALDHYIKEDRGCHYYGRYMDDFYVIARTKRELQLLLKDIERWMSDLHLELNSKTAIFPLKNGLDFLGFHSYLTESGACVQKLRRSEIQRIQTRVKYWEKAYPAGEVTREAVITSFVAWDAFASYGDTYALRLKYAKKVSVIIGVDVKPRRKINSTRSVRALRRVKQEQNIRRKRGDITPRKDLFQPEPRPDSIPPWM